MSGNKLHWAGENTLQQALEVIQAMLKGLPIERKGRRWDRWGIAPEGEMPDFQQYHYRVQPSPPKRITQCDTEYIELTEEVKNRLKDLL